MNKNRLLLAFVRVGLLWYVASALFFSGHTLGFYRGLFDALPNLFNGLSKAVIGCLMGTMVYLILFISKRGDINHSLLPTNNGLVGFSIGNIIKNRTFKESVTNVPNEFIDWFETYRKNHPQHAELFQHAMNIIHGHREIPASPVPGGHGGVSLETHSWNTLREALIHQDKWVYQGMKTRRGVVVFPVQDQNYRFFPDPLIPLSAFCHDIGKTVCYQVNAGQVKEIKPRHDEEGAKIIASLPEFKKLSFYDQDSLMICLGFYHHWRAIPLHVKDRGKALAEFLLMVDVEAGKKEGRSITEPDPDDAEPSNPTPETIQSADFVDHVQNMTEPRAKTKNKITEKTIDAEFGEGNRLFEQAIGALIKEESSQDSLTKSVDSEEERHQIVEIDHFKGIKRIYSKDRCDKAFAMFAQVCSRPGMLNAGTSSIGRKYNDTCFIQEHSMRRAVSQLLQDEWKEKMARVNDEKQHPHEYTLAVLWALHDRDLLVRNYRDDKGNEWVVSPNNALFNVHWRDKTGGWVTRQACLVFKARNELAELAETPDCAAKPEIAKAFWSSHQRSTSLSSTTKEKLSHELPA